MPEIQFEKGEYKALGLMGVLLKFFNGFSALEATIKWNYPDNDVQIACANPRDAVDLTVVIYKGNNRFSIKQRCYYKFDITSNK